MKWRRTWHSFPNNLQIKTSIARRLIFSLVYMINKSEDVHSCILFRYRYAIYLTLILLQVMTFKHPIISATNFLSIDSKRFFPVLDEHLNFYFTSSSQQCLFWNHNWWSFIVIVKTFMCAFVSEESKSFKRCGGNIPQKNLVYLFFRIGY